MFGTMFGAFWHPSNEPEMNPKLKSVIEEKNKTKMKTKWDVALVPKWIKNGTYTYSKMGYTRNCDDYTKREQNHFLVLIK